jgi:mRNA interferase MazF
MERFVGGEVVVIDFPFSDLKETKRRPVLILKVPKGDDLIVFQITGYSYENLVEVNLNEIDFENGSLKRESFVRIDKIATMEKSLVKYKVGPLKNKKFEEIIEKFMSFIKN